jgi:hypothetical protein
LEEIQKRVDQVMEKSNEITRKVTSNPMKKFRETLLNENPSYTELEHRFSRNNPKSSSKPPWNTYTKKKQTLSTSQKK